MASENERLSCRLLVAWLVGAAAYFGGVVLTAYDGILTLFSAPLAAALVSAAVVASSVALGWPLRGLPHSTWLEFLSPVLAGLAASFGLVLFVDGLLTARAEARHDPLTGELIMQLGWPGWCGYLLLVFALTNWPISARETERVSAGLDRLLVSGALSRTRSLRQTLRQWFLRQ